MSEFVYAVVVSRDEAENEVVISVPELPEIISRHPLEDVAHEGLRDLAEDAILIALQSRIEAKEDITEPSRREAASFRVPLDPLVVLKLALYRELRAADISRRELARRLGKNEVIVRRMLDLFHRSKTDQIEDALAALGKRVVISFRTVDLNRAA